MDLKCRSRGLASKIALSEIPMQRSMLNSRICLAEEASFKKFLDEIDVLDKLILYSDVKYRGGTVRYMLPVLAKSRSLQLRSASNVDFLPYTNRHQVRHTEATLTRSSGSR